MQFQLTLTPFPGSSLLPANYQYPLSAAIYKIIQQADESYSAFLHNEGYRLNGKSFKLFCFSDLRVPFRNKGDRLLINGSPATLTISFHIDEAATNFIKGIFINQQLDIADKISRVQFTINQVELLPDPLAAITEDEPEVILQPLSPVVAGRKNERGNYDFLPPDHPQFTYWLLHNWKEKYTTLYGQEDTDRAFANAGMKVIYYNQPPKSRLIAIKAYSPEETKVRGFMNFGVKVKGNKNALELLLNSGAGLYNSAIGSGCMKVVV